MKNASKVPYSIRSVGVVARNGSKTIIFFACHSLYLVSASNTRKSCATSSRVVRVSIELMFCETKNHWYLTCSADKGYSEECLEAIRGFHTSLSTIGKEDRETGMRAVQMMCEKIDTGKFTFESKFVFEFAQNFFPTLRAIVVGNDCSNDDKIMPSEVMQSTVTAAARVCTKISKEYMQ